MKYERDALLKWYSEHKRTLPWRGAKDPYAIWLSEVMLQQTTVTAVIPYYERFLKLFPKVHDLAKAEESQVLEAWAGLGYYSRARMLHRAAKAIAEMGFPKGHQELLELPGFGPYTARAVASLAFHENVGAVDGNVIRVLSRRFGHKVEWWKPQGRKVLQETADALMQWGESSQLNQALMDLGSTVCTPTSAKCFLCPWMRGCVAYQSGQVEALPLSKPRRKREVWIWRPKVVRKGKALCLVKNTYAPFLKGQWLPPGEAERRPRPPAKFLFRHSITHHDIFVVPQTKKGRERGGTFVDEKKALKLNPTSLIRKLLSLV